MGATSRLLLSLRRLFASDAEICRRLTVNPNRLVAVGPVSRSLRLSATVRTTSSSTFSSEAGDLLMQRPTLRAGYRCPWIRQAATR
jgi:hypothetical protein